VALGQDAATPAQQDAERTGGFDIPLGYTYVQSTKPATKLAPAVREQRVPTYNRETIKSVIGTEVGLSEWTTITQEMVNQFAQLTGDPVRLHTDVELARKTPFGGTIAHGLLTLSMIGGFCTAAEVLMEGITMGLNYGFDKVRFVAPVKTGSRIRGRFHLRSMEERNPGQWVSTMDVTIEIEGESKPALVAEWLGMQLVS
jgi:acyl dehydratase